MKKILQLLVSGTLICISSCTMINTLYPLSEDEKDFIFKNELMGTWTVVKDSSSYCIVDTVKNTNGKTYSIQLISINTEDNTRDTTQLKAHLLLLGSTYFLDSWADPPCRSTADHETYKDFLITRHFITRVSFKSSIKLEISNSDPDELIAMIRNKKINLSYTALKKDDYLVLDKPEQLRKAALQSAAFKNLYKEVLMLEKQ